MPPSAAGLLALHQQPPSKLSAAAATADSDRKVAKIDNSRGTQPGRSAKTTHHLGRNCVYFGLSGFDGLAKWCVENMETPGHTALAGAEARLGGRGRSTPAAVSGSNPSSLFNHQSIVVLPFLRLEQ